jgi:hypothetical protein
VNWLVRKWQAMLGQFFFTARAGSTQGQDIQLVARGIFVNEVFLETKDGNDTGSYDCKYILTDTLSQDAQPEITFAVWSSLMDSFDWQKYIHLPTDDPNSIWEEPVPDFLIIEGPTKLDDQRWKRTVRVSQDKQISTGKFGEEGFGTDAVVLLVKQPGKPTKTMRIPVSGNVTQ